MELDQPISIRFRNEESDFFRVLWQTRRRTLLITFFLICLVVVSFAFYASLATPADPLDDRRWVIYATSVVVPLFIAAVMYFALRSQAKKAAASAKVVRMTFDNEGVEIDGPEASSKSSWTAYEKIVETPDHFIFYIQSNIFYGVPKRFFDGPAEIQRVQAFISDSLRK